MEDYTLYKVKTVSRCHELIAGYEVRNRKERELGREGVYWYLIEGFLSAETLEADVWIKNLWFSCQECEQFQSDCQPHQEREEGVRVCTYMRMWL